MRLNFFHCAKLFDRQVRKEIAKIQLLPVRFLGRFVKGERSFVLTIFLGFSAYSLFYFLRDFSAEVNLARQLFQPRVCKVALILRKRPCDFARLLFALTEPKHLTIEFRMAYAPTEIIRSSKIHQETVDDSAAGKR